MGEIGGENMEATGRPAPLNRVIHYWRRQILMSVDESNCNNSPPTCTALGTVFTRNIAVHAASYMN